MREWSVMFDRGTAAVRVKRGASQAAAPPSVYNMAQAGRVTSKGLPSCWR